MHVREWFRPPHHVAALFLLATLVPSVLLAAFGWRLWQQDRALEQQQLDARRDQAADLIVAALERELTATEQALRAKPAAVPVSPSDDAVVLTFTGTAMDERPAGRLLYSPRPRPGTEAPAAAFARGEEAEYQRVDSARAIAEFSRLARSSDPAIRSGALIRLARNLRRIGAVERALEAYAAAAAIDGAAVGDVPTALFARAERCALLSALHRARPLREEAQELRQLLLGGRWRLSRSVFQLYFDQTSGWLGTDDSPTTRARLSAAVERASAAWGDVPEGPAPRRSIVVDGVPFTILWQQTATGAAALVAGPAYVGRHWRAPLASLEARNEVNAALGEAGPRAPGVRTTRRAEADTRLPWPVVVTTDADAAAAGFRERRMAWLFAIVILGALVLGGTYATGRAIARELAVARLQSDFVAAVSHEFRTPLTSLRQLTEMLIDRPDASLERRQAYYAALGRQTERLHRLVESLLDLGRMEAGASPYHLEVTSAAAFVSNVVTQFSEDPAARGHRIELVVREDPGIAADRDALASALWNLLDNATKYSPDTPAVWVDVWSEGKEACIAVRDRGFGIPASEQPDVFDRFVRGEQAKRERISGTGIGLSMVRHIVAGHGGSVTLTSEPGAGSTFVIRLPVAAQAESPRKEAVRCLES